MAKVYEDGKDDPYDMTILENFCDLFLTNVSLRRTSQNESRIHRSHVGSMAFVKPPSGDCNPLQFIREPIEPAKTNGRPKIVRMIRSSIETSNENRCKQLYGYCGQVGHISTSCTKHRLHVQSQGGGVD